MASRTYVVKPDIKAHAIDSGILDAAFFDDKYCNYVIPIAMLERGCRWLVIACHSITASHSSNC